MKRGENIFCLISPGTDPINFSNEIGCALYALQMNQWKYFRLNLSVKSVNNSNRYRAVWFTKSLLCLRGGNGIIPVGIHSKNSSIIRVWKEISTQGTLIEIRSHRCGIFMQKWKITLRATRAMTINCPKITRERDVLFFQRNLLKRRGFPSREFPLIVEKSSVRAYKGRFIRIAGVFDCRCMPWFSSYTFEASDIFFPFSSTTVFFVSLQTLGGEFTVPIDPDTRHRVAWTDLKGSRSNARKHFCATVDAASYWFMYINYPQAGRVIIM